MVRYVIDVEERPAWNMRREIIVLRQRSHAGHLERCVDDLDLGIIEMGGEPFGGDEGIIGWCCHVRKISSITRSSWPDLIRPSIFLQRMDTRVKPACDDVRFSSSVHIPRSDR